MPSVHTRTQALIIKKPAGGSNSAKAQLPKFLVMLEEKKKGRELKRLLSDLGHVSLKPATFAVVFPSPCLF